MAANTLPLSPPPLHTHTHTYLWFRGTDVALWVGWCQRTCDKQMFSWIRILGQVGLVKERDDLSVGTTQEKKCSPFCTC